MKLVNCEHKNLLILKGVGCMKKIISLMFTMVMVFSMTETVFASDGAKYELDTQTKNGIINGLRAIEDQKEQFGLFDVDFQEIMVANPIYSYEYLNEDVPVFSELWMTYPLVSGEKIVAFATNTGNGEYQVDSALVKEIGDNVTFSDSFALVYDATSCYLYTGYTLIPLYEFGSAINSREVLTDELNYLPFLENVYISDVVTYESLGYTNVETRSSTYIGCNVPIVLQALPDGRDSYICWAATIASIVNYRNGTNLTAINIAQYYYGNDYYNRPGTNVYVVRWMAANYCQTYSYQAKTLSDSLIAKNLSEGYPLYGVFSYQNGSHAVCIYGINTSLKCIYVMDPESSYKMAASYSTSGYSYISRFSGVELTYVGTGASCWV